MTRKADRFDRIADKLIADEFDECPDGCRYHSKVIARHLRNEHAWFRRMVREYANEPDERPEIAQRTEFNRGFNFACKTILTRLTQRRR